MIEAFLTLPLDLWTLTWTVEYSLFPKQFPQTPPLDLVDVPLFPWQSCLVYYL